ncbi:ferredoxin reductase [Prauserella marina]|uniref:Ferredoxin-NADP reductase n=1 Tax=Prauserella marina TaxID=530584 RepID=A0A222VR24_9PSEU|nr:ferredoxin reductase [Prauserella marina]ASR36193.1 ferredoxin reductase [Prauserella marina]PWV76945.1 ferredoxin-NADP reductase [Prauserella marina]SDD00889.1 Ferredoxin-NADP reductase [Prauserella marina]
MGKLTALAGALLTPHGADRYLELLNPMLVRHEVRGVVTRVRRQTSDTVTIELRPSAAWRGFTAGQHVRLSVDIDGVRRTRCYSPCTSQHREGTFELTVKAHSDGLVSGHLFRTAKPGVVVGLSPAEGDFTLPRPRPEKLLLISGGSGITPVLSMLRTLADEAHHGEVAFVHYANGPADIPGLAELSALARRCGARFLRGHPRATGGDLRGHCTREHLALAAPWYREAAVYVCGPPPLMTAVGEIYAADGASEQVHTEQFTATAPALPAEGTTVDGRVRFARTGTETGNSGLPLLDQAEAAGLSLDHGCRMGICYSCTQRKTRGTVRNVKTGSTCSETDQDIQLCVSVPLGDVEIDC